MNGILVIGHLGLGDQIIMNALYRQLATGYYLVVVPVKYHNLVSVAHMLKDVPNILLRPVEDDDEMIMVRDKVWKGKVLNLGMYGTPAFNGSIFDQEFYKHAQMDFKSRWDKFKVTRSEKEIAVPLSYQFNQPIWFVHDDPLRSYCIDLKKTEISGTFGQVPMLIFPNPKQSPNLFDWRKYIEAADEIHVINSSFAILIDSIDLPKNPKLFLHVYARGCNGDGGEMPTFKKDWNKIT